MIDFLKRFWAILASIAAVAGLGLGAEAIHELWAFWLVLGASLVISLFRTQAVARGFDVINRIRIYPKLLKQFGELKERAADLENQLSIYKDECVTSFDRGLIEGARSLRGTLLSAGINPPPVVSSISMDEEALQLFANCDESSIPRTGCRFVVVVKNTQKQLGVLEVQSVEAHRGVAVLTCVERTTPKFWERLEAKALEDPSAPDGIELLTYYYSPFGTPQNDQIEPPTFATEA